MGSIVYPIIYLVILGLASIVAVLGTYSVLRAVPNRRRRWRGRGQALAPDPRFEPRDPEANSSAATGSAPAISVLKPLCGADDNLERNLTTFFEQRYPAFELVFGVEGADDPAVALVERLRRAHPSVRCRLVVHDGGRAINPKVSNLRAMLEVVTTDVVVISDSNISVGPAYLSGMMARLQEPGVGLVTSLFAGTREDTLGATLDNLQLNGQVAAAIAASHVIGRRPAVVGKSMMFRRSQFEALGGFESVANVLAEDYVMGRMFREAGYRVQLAGEVIENVNQSATLGGFWRRHLRWSQLRSRLNPVLYLAEPLSVPLFVALWAPLFGVSALPALIWAVTLTMARDAVQWQRLRGWGGLAAALPLSPIKELVVLLAWLSAPFQRHVSWRGRSVRVSSGTRLYARRPMAPRHLSVVS
jgi:ceramide glucosyltransferase